MARSLDWDTELLEAQFSISMAELWEETDGVHLAAGDLDEDSGEHLVSFCGQEESDELNLVFWERLDGEVLPCLPHRLFQWYVKARTDGGDLCGQCLFFAVKRYSGGSCCG